GYDLGVLSPEIFAMMVIMALVTTFMTGPSLDIINFLFKSKKDDSLEVSNVFQPEYRILLSFSDPEKGKHLFRLGSQFTRNEERKDVITAMNIISLDDMYHYDLETYEKESFAPIIQASKQDQQMLTTLFKVSNNIDTEIAEAANKGKYDL